MSREIRPVRRFPNPAAADVGGVFRSVLSVRFDATGRFVLGACYKVVRLWSSENGLLVQTYGDCGYEVTGVVSRSDGERFASCAGKGATIWDVATAQAVGRYTNHEQRVSCVAYGGSTDDLLVTGSWDKCVRLFDTRTSVRSPVQVLRGARDSVSSVACLAETCEILSTSVDGKARLYDVRRGVVLVDDFGAPLASACFTRDKECMLFSCLDEALRLVDKETGEVLACYEGHRNKEYRLDCSVLFDDSAVVSGGEDGVFHVWDLAGSADVLQPCVTYDTADRSPLCAVDCHPARPVVVVGVQDGTVGLLEISPDRI